MSGHLVLKNYGLFKVYCYTFLDSVLALIFKILRFFIGHVYRSKEEEINSSYLHKYEFKSVNGVVGFLQKPLAVEFAVEELFLGEDEEFDGECSVKTDLKMDQVEEDEAMEEQDFSYEIDLLPELNQEPVFSGFEFTYSTVNFNPESLKADSVNSSAAIDEAVGEDDEFREFEASSARDTCQDLNGGADDCFTLKTETDLDDDYIELEPGNPLINPDEEIFQNFQRNYSDSDSYSDSEIEDEDEEDALSEHRNLVQQMKMELRNCRIGGLPTIAEDCEISKMAEDLKPLQIDDRRSGYKQVMAEIQKLYKSYAERMRKLDILNFQALQSLSFLPIKDSEILTYSKKKPPILKHFPKIWPCKLQRVHADPALRSIAELNRDLELVYVGQLCLSWEILLWFYVKLKELSQYDSNGSHSYNRVAEEFQQFQVLLQRFVEDESFRGPRIQSYVKNRCLIRGLLHVPMIKDDCMKDKEEKDETDSISLDSLLQIIKDSMLVFQKFLCSDRYSKKTSLNQRNNDHRHNQMTSLMWEINTILQKKERRLKEKIRSKGCIMKKLLKQEEEEDQLVVCEVVLRLVSRIIELSRLNKDQLFWCKTKLNNIKFVDKRVHLENSFMFFPC